jgi:hypothetical protein
MLGNSSYVLYGGRSGKRAGFAFEILRFSRVNDFLAIPPYSSVTIP